MQVKNGKKSGNGQSVEEGNPHSTPFTHDATCCSRLNPFVPTVPTCAVRETASLGIMGAPRVPPLNPSETIVF